MGRNVLFSATAALFFLGQCTATRIAGPAISSSLAQQLCSPEFLKGVGVLGGMGINGMGGIGGGFRMSSPTLCIKPGGQIASFNAGSSGGAAAAIAKSPYMKKLTNMQAITSLLHLQEMDCKKGKVNPKTQACFLYRSIAKKAKEPISSITATANTLTVNTKKKTAAMFVVERFGNLTPRKKEEPTFEKLLKDPATYSIQFNEFDDVLNRVGQMRTHKKANKCAECLNSLKTSIAVGDLECECEDNISINLDDLKGISPS